jgi:hypothetical protein
MELLLIAMVIVGLLVVLSLIGWVAALVLQAGVIVQKFGEQPYQDTSTYSLQQGRDVGREPEEPRNGA